MCVTKSRRKPKGSRPAASTCAANLAPIQCLCSPQDRCCPAKRSLQNKLPVAIHAQPQATAHTSQHGGLHYIFQVKVLGLPCRDMCGHARLPWCDVNRAPAGMCPRQSPPGKSHPARAARCKIRCAAAWALPMTCPAMSPPDLCHAHASNTHQPELQHAGGLLLRPQDASSP